MALESGFFNKVFVFLWIVYMVAIRHEIAQMFGVFIAFTVMVVRRKLFAHHLPRFIRKG